MARIPEYQSQFDRQGVDLAAPKQQLNAPLAAFGSDGAGLQEAGKGLMNMGSALAVAAARMNEERAIATAAAAEAALHKKHDEAAADLRARKGDDAADVVKIYDEMFPKMRDEIGADLDPAAKRIFDQKAHGLYINERRMYANQAASERREALVNNNTALADIKAAAAETQYTDRASVDMHIEGGKDALRIAIQAKGVSPDSEVGKGLLAKYESGVLGRVVDRFVSARNFSDAKTLLTEFKESGRLLGADAEKVELKLKSFELQNQADQIAASWRGLSPDAAFNAAQKIEDPELRRLALGQKRAMDAERDRARSQYVQDSIVRGIDMVDRLSNDPVKLQQYLDSLPKGSPDALRIQQQIGTYGRNVIAASTGATGRFTSAGDYLSLLREVGPGGSITNEKDLMTRPEMARVDVVDRKKLVEQLKGNTHVDRPELLKQFKLLKGYSDDTAKLSDEDNVSFMRFQEYMEALTKDTKMGKDPDYIKKMAARWRLEGETKEWYAPGRGVNRTFGEVVGMDPAKRDEFVPALPETGSTDRSALDKKFENRDFAKAAMKKYGTTDEELAKRMYFRDLIFNDVPMMPKAAIGKGN